MCEINHENFNKLYPSIKKTLQEARFISLDLEFSALNPLKSQTPSLFDTPAERYLKLKKNLEMVVPIQVGLTAFVSHGVKDNTFVGKTFTFYVQPACFQGINRNFFFQSNTLQFLRLYGFDFNKFVYSGLNFINRTQETELREQFKNEEISEIDLTCRMEFENILSANIPILNNWYPKANIGESLTFPKLYDSKKVQSEMIYFLHKNFRESFPNLWTSDADGDFVVTKLSEAEYKKTKCLNSLEEKLIQNLLGFTRIFRLISKLQKPIVGHNLLQDLILMLHSFEQDLPNSYDEFKKLVSSLLPVIFDTRTISYELRREVAEEKRWNDKGLDTIYNYFKNGRGRHLAENSPAIICDSKDENLDKFHDAGWDSYCAGYIFIRLAHLSIYQKYPESKTFVSSELIGGLAKYRNRVNVIRGSINNINFEGPDPISQRPPFLVVETLKNRPVNIAQVTSILSNYGFIEVKRIPYQSRMALVAVDNFGNARRILQTFKSNKEFQVKQYSAVKHSPVARAFLMGGITVTGALFIWLTHSALRK